jgi:hypothetical protein
MKYAWKESDTHTILRQDEHSGEQKKSHNNKTVIGDIGMCKAD